MKRKSQSIIVCLIGIAIMFAVVTCKPKYSIEFTSLESDTISTNPTISWQISPKPKGEIESTIKIVKLENGEIPETALKKEGISVVVHNTTFYQYVNKSILEANSNYVVHITTREGEARKPIGQLTTADGKTVQILNNPFTVICDKDINDTHYIIEFTPNYTPYMNDIIDWAIIKIPRCVYYNPLPYWHNGKLINIGNHCMWEKEDIRRNAALDAINNTGSQFSVEQSGQYIITQNGTNTIITTVIPVDSIIGDFAFILYLKSNLTGYSRTYYFY